MDQQEQLVHKEEEYVNKMSAVVNINVIITLRVVREPEAKRETQEQLVHK